MNRVKGVLSINEVVWVCCGCGVPLERTTDNFTAFDLKRGNHECRSCHALRTRRSEHARHERLETRAIEISVEQADHYQTLTTKLARELGFTRSATVKGFVYEDGLAVFKYFQSGKWFLAISQKDARYLIATHAKNAVRIQEIQRPVCVGDTDTCGLCGERWTVRCNIHKSVLDNGVELFCCTRCRNVRELCDDVDTLRKIADGLAQAKK